MTWANDVLYALSKDGLRVTEPRRTIVEHIVLRAGPFTAEQLVGELPEVGRATIYRTLEVLSTGHWLARIHHDEGEHAYIPAAPHKHQLVCTRCGTAVTFDTCDLDGLMAQLSQRTGFAIEGHALEAFGVCQQCQPARPAGPQL
ncbi:MAG: transcriptional repressor [Herpetosiphonaceae bacterium]|nr:transcriptional repressor [Herpetosiphonaceae bacterium]